MPAALAVAMAGVIALLYGAASFLGQRQALTAAAPQAQQAAAGLPSLRRLLEAARGRPGGAAPAELPAAPKADSLPPLPRIGPEPAPPAPCPPLAAAPEPAREVAPLISGPEPEEALKDKSVFIEYFPVTNPARVWGSTVEVEVDGRKDKLGLRNSNLRGDALKAVLVLPKDGAPHTIVFTAMSLDCKGRKKIRKTIQDDGQGHRTADVVEGPAWDSGFPELKAEAHPRSLKD